LGIVAACACGLVVTAVLHRDQSPRGGRLLDAMVGDRVCSPDGRPWAAKGSKAFVIVVSPTCAACRLSQDFSDELYAYAIARRVPVVYLIGERHSLDAVARDLAASGRLVVRANLMRFGIMQEPTFLRINGDGYVESRWFGMVPAERRREVFESITEGSTLERYRRVAERDAGRLLSAGRVQFIALSERGRKGSRVFPLSEIEARWRYELDPALTTLIDCSSAGLPVECQDAAILLSKAGFSDVVAVGLPVRPSDCGM
jgi:hypothetical protein